MKKIYTLSIVLSSILGFSQQTISFEESEGYVLGDINGQKGWTVTEANGSFITNQVVTNEVAKTGDYSFKNAHLDEFNPQWYPIFGIEKSFSTPLDYKSTSISYDFYGKKKMGSDYEFAVYNYDEDNDEFNILFAVGFDYSGELYLYTKMNFDGYTKPGKTWNIENWHNVKVNFTGNTIECYYDEELVYSGENDSQLPIHGINFLHNNYGGDAYYDNIVINDQVMSVDDLAQKKVAFYPNPVKDILKIDLPNQESVNIIEVYNAVGQKIASFAKVNEINLSDLKAGVYMINIKTGNEKVYNSKIVKQ